MSSKKEKITFTVLRCQRTGALSLAVKQGDHGHFNLSNKGGPVWDEVEDFTVQASEVERFIKPKLAEENQRMRRVLVRLFQACEPVRRWFHMRYVDAKARSAATADEPAMLSGDHVMLDAGVVMGTSVTTAQLCELHFATEEVKHESIKWLQS